MQSIRNCFLNPSYHISDNFNVKKNFVNLTVRVLNAWQHLWASAIPKRSFENETTARWNAYGFYDLAHFQTPISQGNILNFYNCFGCGGIYSTYHTFGATRACAIRTEFSNPGFYKWNWWCMFPIVFHEFILVLSDDFSSSRNNVTRAHFFKFLPKFKRLSAFNGC